MMRIDIATLFPDMCESVLSESIIGRARKNGYVEFYCHNIRDYTQDKHHRVDDTPYGGGKGMVMQADPIYKCYQSICDTVGTDNKPYVVYMSPQGNVLNEQKCIELSKMDNILLICGHYEGIDERVIEEIVDEEISIGDYVLTGGELAALVLCDSVARLCDGVLASEECYEEESHYNGLLEYPQYTRPEVWHGKAVPSVLLSGHHKNIIEWRQKTRLARTKYKRPDMLKAYLGSQVKLNMLDSKLLKEIDIEENTVYYDITQFKEEAVVVYFVGHTTLPAGTTLYVMPEYENDDNYRYIADKHNIYFIFENDDNKPKVDFYAVPQIDIFAYDNSGGMYATVGNSTDIGNTINQICYIKNMEVYTVAGNLKEFIFPIESIAKRMKKCKIKLDDVKLFNSLAEAKHNCKFINPPISE